jgi:hypothetical protein
MFRKPVWSDLSAVSPKKERIKALNIYSDEEIERIIKPSIKHHYV